MADSTTSSTQNQNIPPYARTPVFPSANGNRGGRRNWHRKPKNTQQRPEGQTVNAQDNVEVTVPSTSSQPNRNQSRGVYRGNRGGYKQRGGNQNAENRESLLPHTRPPINRSTGNPPPSHTGNYQSHPTGYPPSSYQRHSFNPNADPFIPSNIYDPVSLVRVTSITDNPIPQKGKSRGGRNKRNNCRNLTEKMEQKPSEIKAKKPENPNAPLRERLKNRLEDNDYECAICCSVITAKQGIWSCKKCYNMFHISGGCIVRWARKSIKEDNTEEWRCPTCQTRYQRIPYNYYCFCGKESNPSVTLGETPHSCGQVCSGERGPGCPHPCTELCHPGPCVECPVMIKKQCNCGKIEKAVRCGTNVQISCDEVCNRLLSCGKHHCTQVCHAGDCQSCDEKLEQTCLCGQNTRIIPCDSSTDSIEYQCNLPCPGKYNCGIHQCTRRCHVQGENCGPCPSAPERITNCPCGRQSLSELGAKAVRTSCKDPIPVCEAICNKVLRCGPEAEKHRCLEKCHMGSCPPCRGKTTKTCRCEGHTEDLSCKEYLDINDNGEEFLCKKRCHKKKLCGIHRCLDVCCIKDFHICEQVCNKRLSCGLHNCERLCHRGDCGACLHASFEDQFCHCGRTMRPPPIPCGTPLPVCDEPCARPHPCGHNVHHKCHSNLICPPCTQLVERECYGKHEIRKNIPCHMEGVSCGRECGKDLPCGVHKCVRRCHFGNCLKPGESCSQKCSIIKKGCEHPCNVLCHGLSECPETMCEALVMSLCDCGRRKENMRCIEVEKQKARLRALAVETAAESGPVSEAILKRTRSMESLVVLSCSDDCKKVARNKQIAEALSIVVNDDGDTESPRITFTESLKTGLKTYPQLVSEMENIFTKMIAFLEDQSNPSNVASYHFPAMHLDKRRLIHEYAIYFQLETISVDEVPKRSVIVSGKRGIARAPLILLSELVKYPSVMKYTGSTTLKHNINDEIKKAAAAASEEEGGMKQLKGTRPLYKRMPPKIFVPEPIKQSNFFSALGSDNEEEEEKESKSVKGKDPSASEERDIDWWSDEEVVKKSHIDEEKAEAKKNSIRDVELNEETGPAIQMAEGIPNSWSDEE